ncbi:MAG: hypothetical protein GC186_13375 [Rhodobacteraceae bacterium]|nr:hypothetical protein [Paracoccaceae bacterium]
MGQGGGTGMTAAMRITADPAHLPIAGSAGAPKQVTFASEPLTDEAPDPMSLAEPPRYIERDVNDEGGASMRAASLCALAIAAALWFLGKMPPDVRHESILMLVPAIGSAIGPFFLINGVRAGWRLRRYGRSTIEIDPPVQGHPLCGVIRTERPVDAVGRYSIRLRCEDVQGRTVATTLFKSVCHVPHSKVDSTRGIPFLIEPLNTEEKAGTNDRLMASRVRWWIEVSAMTEFISYTAVFDVSALLHEVEDSDEQPWWQQPDTTPKGAPSPR